MARVDIDEPPSLYVHFCIEERHKLPFAKRFTEEMVVSKTLLKLLYTDGISEALNPDDEEYGRKRLAAAITQSRAGNAASISKAVIEDVERFCADKVSDDRSLIILKPC
jgi:stage II sporulation SpoE-like protein